jgi:hypothetical protein
MGNDHSEHPHGHGRRGFAAWTLVVIWCGVLIAVMTFSNRVARLGDTAIRDATDDVATANENVDRRTDRADEYRNAAQKKLDEAQQTRNSRYYDQQDAYRRKDQPETVLASMRAHADADLANADTNLTIQKAARESIDNKKDDEWKTLQGDIDAAKERLAKSQHVLGEARKGSDQTSWLIKAFVFGSFGAVVLLIFELYRARGRRLIDEDPLAAIFIMIGGGFVGLMSVSYLASNSNDFSDIGSNINHKVWVVGVAIAAGISWDVVIRTTRALVAKYIPNLDN